MTYQVKKRGNLCAAVGCEEIRSHAVEVSSPKGLGLPHLTYHVVFCERHHDDYCAIHQSCVVITNNVVRTDG